MKALEKTSTKWIIFIILYFVVHGIFYSLNISFLGNQGGFVVGIVPAAVTTAFIVTINQVLMKSYKFRFNKTSTSRKFLYFSISLIFCIILLILFSNKYGIFPAVLFYFILVAVFRSILIAGFDWLKNFPFINKRTVQLYLGIASVLLIPVVLFYLYPVFILSGKIQPYNLKSVATVNETNIDTTIQFQRLKVGNSGLSILLPENSTILKDTTLIKNAYNPATIKETKFSIIGNDIIDGSINFNKSSVDMKSKIRILSALKRQVATIISAPQVEKIEDSAFKSLVKNNYEGAYLIGKIFMTEKSGNGKLFIMTIFITDNKDRLWNINLFTNEGKPKNYEELNKILNSIKVIK